MKRKKLLVSLSAILVICLTLCIAQFAFAEESGVTTKFGDALSNGRVTQEVTENDDLKITLSTDMNIGDTRAYFKQPITLDMANNKWFEMNFTIDQFNVDGGLRISFLSSENDFPMDSYGDGFGVYFWDETAWGYPELQAFRCDFYKYGKAAGLTGLIEAKAVRSDANKITGQSFHLKVWEFDADSIAIQLDRDDNGNNIQAIGAFAKTNLPEGFDIKNCVLLITPDVDINRAHSYENDIVLTIKDVNGGKVVERTTDDPAVEEGLRDFDSAKGDKLSYDQILVNGTQIANGNDAVIAAKKLVDGSDGSISTISMHGWFGNANSKIASYGYMIDDGEPVYGDFASDAEADVINAGGESRYTVNVDVSGLKDGNEHMIWVVVKLENGAIVKLNRFDNRGQEGEKDREVYVNYKAPKEADTTPVTEPDTQPVTEPVTPPQTGDSTVAVFAVIVVLALGVAVVFAKKRSF